MASQTSHLKEDLFQVANGELNKDGYDSWSSVREDYGTNGIHKKVVVLIVGGLPLRSKNHDENEGVEEVGIVGESAEWDPEAKGKESIDEPSVSIVTDDNDKGQAQTPSESRECDVEYVLSCTKLISNQ